MGQPSVTDAVATNDAAQLQLALRSAEAALTASQVDGARLRTGHHNAIATQDLVIQHLFVAGLQLQALETSVSPEVAEAVEAGIDQINQAIAALRASITQLTRDLR